MSKQYKLLKDFRTPINEIDAGAVSEKVGGYYFFKFKGAAGESHLLGNGFLVSDPESNPEWFEEVKPKEWEIVDGMMSADPQGFARIKSVKRLSDGEVFTVGDYSCYGYIKGFEIRDDKMRVLYPAIGDWQFLSAVSKQIPQPNKKRIEVHGINQLKGDERTYRFYTSAGIPKEKLPAIKSAIEEILNDGDDCLDGRLWYTMGIERYTKNELIEAERLAFEAARLGLGLRHSDIRNYFYGKYYKTFSDYKNRKQ